MPNERRIITTTTRTTKLPSALAAKRNVLVQVTRGLTLSTVSTAEAPARAITMSEPANTQSGTPKAITAAFASRATATNAAAYATKPRFAACGPAKNAALIDPDVPLDTVSSAMATSAAVGRLAGSFSRHRMTRSASAGGVSGRLALTAVGLVVRCATSVFCGDNPLNGGSPVSSSYARQPSE